MKAPDLDLVPDLRVRWSSGGIGPRVPVAAGSPAAPGARFQGVDENGSAAAVDESHDPPADHRRDLSHASLVLRFQSGLPQR